jgi:hypothetical protein
MMAAFTQRSVITQAQFGNLHDDKPFANVSSMDYWRGDPEIKRWLEAAECPRGASMFEGRMHVYGLGYADPRLVKDERYRSKRWRPWAETTSASEAAAQLKTDAMLYALLGNVGGKMSADDQAACDSAKAAVAEIDNNWTMPLVVRTKREFAFGRLPLHEQVAGSVSENSDHWRAGDSIGSIGKFAAYFDAQKEHVEAVSSERELFEKNLVPELGSKNYRFLLSGLLAYLNDLFVDARDVTSGDMGKEFMLVIDSMRNRLKVLLNELK